MLKLASFTCGHQNHPVKVESPRFSWVLESDRQGVFQASYRLTLTTLQGTPVYDSGVVSSAASVLVPMEGVRLEVGCRYLAAVTVVDNAGEEAAASLSFAAPHPADGWVAKMITGGSGAIPTYQGAVQFRKEIALAEAPVDAVLYATAQGVYELQLNGGAVSDRYLAPGMVEFRHHHPVQCYDLSGKLTAGKNVLGATVGVGWYKGAIQGWALDNLCYFGDTAGLYLELYLTFADGSRQLICSDETFVAKDSALSFSEIYHGDRYDARIATEDYTDPAFDAADWDAAVIVKDFNPGLLDPELGVPVMPQERLTPSLITTPKGETVLDFHQNMTGVVEFRVNAKAGDIVELQHFEVLDPAGNVYLDNLRSAKELVRYICRDGLNVYRPRHSFQGFQYVQIKQYPGTPDPADFTAIVLHSDMTPAGDFTCSDPLVNQLVKNIRWGMKGNFLDIPTDCPQRDERMGWTGDAQAFVKTAGYLYQVAPFFRKWLADVRFSQMDDGGIPYVVPDLLTGMLSGEDARHDHRYGSSGWGDVAVIAPFTVYQASGDLSILEESYDSMKKWVEFIRSNADDGLLWNSGYHYGDWLALDAPNGDHEGFTPKFFVATAFYAYSTLLLAKSAGILGNTADEKEYTDLYHAIVAALQKEYFTPTGRLSIPTQTAHVLSLQFGLTPDPERTARDLDAIIERDGNHLTTGFLGTPYLCHVLASHGYLSRAYDLLLRREYPSWLYPVTRGATTVWEHWDSLKPDDTFWSAGMNSFNHYAYGAVGDFLFEKVAGLTPLEPGFAKSRIAPMPDGKLEHAAAWHLTPYGKLASGWWLKDGVMTLEVSVPCNTTALVVLPDGTEQEVTSGFHVFRCEL